MHAQKTMQGTTLLIVVGYLKFLKKYPKNRTQVKMESYLKNSKKKKKRNYPATWSCGI